MDAAAILFAKHGFDGVSLRQLTSQAKVNLAAVNYYFAGKEGLYSELIRSRVSPINEVRLSQLAAAAAAAGDQPPPLEQILEILARPVLETHRDGGVSGPPIVQILARCLADPPLSFMIRETAEEMQVTFARFAQAIRRHFPQLPPEEFLWRFTFVVGALQHSLANFHQMSSLTRGICRDADHEGALARFVAFAAGTFRAPARPAGQLSKTA